MMMIADDDAYADAYAVADVDAVACTLFRDNHGESVNPIATGTRNTTDAITTRWQ